MITSTEAIQNQNKNTYYEEKFIMKNLKKIIIGMLTLVMSL